MKDQENFENKVVDILVLSRVIQRYSEKSIYDELAFIIGYGSFLTILSLLLFRVFIDSTLLLFTVSLISIIVLRIIQEIDNKYLLFRMFRKIKKIMIKNNWNSKSFKFGVNVLTVNLEYSQLEILIDDEVKLALR